MNRLARGIAHHGKAALQYAMIGVTFEKLCRPVEPPPGIGKSAPFRAAKALHPLRQGFFLGSDAKAKRLRREARFHTLKLCLFHFRCADERAGEAFCGIVETLTRQSDDVLQTRQPAREAAELSAR